MSKLSDGLFDFSLRALEFLLDHGASVQHCDSRGMNGLMHAAKKGHGAVVLMMLERGAGMRPSSW